MDNGHHMENGIHHHLTLPPGITLTEGQRSTLDLAVREHHNFLPSIHQCSNILIQNINAPVETVWSIVRRFDRPQLYKVFIRRCSIQDPSNITVGSIRELDLVSGLPLTAVTEWLDIFDDDRHIIGLSIVGGEHRLENFRSITTLHGFIGSDGRRSTIVLESYIVDVPEGNTSEETCIFVNTINQVNLRSLASVSERMIKG